MKKSIFFTLIILFSTMFFITSCVTTMSETSKKNTVKEKNIQETGDNITFTLNRDVMYYVEENILKYDPISEDTRIRVDYNITGSPASQKKSDTILLSDLATDSFTLNNISKKKYFNVDIDIFYNDNLVYTNTSDRIAISSLTPNPEVTFPSKQVSSKIIYNLNNGTNNIENPYEYFEDSFVFLLAPERKNSDFLGWYTNPEFKGEPVTDFYGTDYPEGITLYAKWAMQNKIQSLKSILNDDSITLTWINPADINFRKVIISSPELKNNLIVQGKAAQRVSINIPISKDVREYTFTLVTEDFLGNRSTGMTVTEELWYPFTEEVIFLESGTDGSAGPEGTYVLFGDYPQSEKAPEVNIINQDIKNENGYYEGDDGYFYAKYNGIYYKVEPIKWRIVTDNYIDGDGNSKGSLLVAENALDIFPYHINYTDRVINDEIISANNYEYSNIRAYLNGLDGTSYKVSDFSGKGFINEAFTTRAQKFINYTTVDNSPKSTGRINNDFTCDNTSDKVFLLSFAELTNPEYGFKEKYNISDVSRIRKVTDYSKAKTSVDLLQNGVCSYWLRSPVNYADEMLMFVNYTDNTLKQYMVDNQFGRIVPAITVSF